MKQAKSLLVLLTLSIFFGACGPVVKLPTPVGGPETKVPYPAGQYYISVGDQLDVKFFYNPELNENLVVRPDGRISLQLVGEVMAAGRTPEELTSTLKKQYADQLATPEVTVIVRSFTPYKVFVDGEVNSRQVVALVSPMNILQAITYAGGFTETARTDEVVVIRRSQEGKAVAIPVNTKVVIDGTDMRQNIELMPYDIVYVPRSAIGNAAKWVDLYLRRTILLLPEQFLLYYNLTTR